MIPQNNPYANYFNQKDAIDEAIHRVLNKGQYILGDEVKAFELEFANYIGVKYAVGTANGTDALHLALRACDIGNGDEVITVSHTAVATIAAIEMCGATPVLLDIDPNFYTIDSSLVEKAITEKTKAIVPVHLYGQPADIVPLLEFARQYKLHLIEDCAQAHGAVYGDQEVGSWGDAGVFSFYPTKNLGCLGDGGAVTTNNPRLYNRLLSLRQYGWNTQRVSQEPGFNSRLDELQAAILRVKLEYLDGNNKRRFEISRMYNQYLESFPISLPSIIPNTNHVFHQYVIRCETKSKRDYLVKSLQRKGIHSSIHYPMPIHLQPAYKNRIRLFNSLSITEAVSKTILSLPIFPELNDKDVYTIIKAIEKYYLTNESTENI